MRHARGSTLRRSCGSALITARDTEQAMKSGADPRCGIPRVGGERHREPGVAVQFEPVLPHRFVLECLVGRVECARAIWPQLALSSRWMRVCIKGVNVGPRLRHLDEERLRQSGAVLGSPAGEMLFSSLFTLGGLSLSGSLGSGGLSGLLCLALGGSGLELLHARQRAWPSPRLAAL